MKVSREELCQIIKEELQVVLNEFEEKEITDPCEMAKDPTRRPIGVSKAEAEKLCADKEQTANLREEDELDDSPLDDLMGAPLSPEEKVQHDADYQKYLEAEKIVDVVFDFMDRGMSKEQILKMLKKELETRRN